MDLMKSLNEKLIAELIPEVGPRIIFMSYWKNNFFETKEPSTSNNVRYIYNKYCCFLFSFLF